MTEQRFVMVSEWMGNGNINTFVNTNINANRLDLVGFANHELLYSTSSFTLFSQLGDVTKGLMYMHGQGIVHGDLKGVCVKPPLT